MKGKVSRKEGGRSWEDSSLRQTQNGVVKHNQLLSLRLCQVETAVTPGVTTYITFPAQSLLRLLVNGSFHRQAEKVSTISQMLCLDVTLFRVNDESLWGSHIYFPMTSEQQGRAGEQLQAFSFPNKATEGPD